MTAISLPFAAAGSRRAPDASELSNGFPCGPADIELFNWLNWWLTGQLGTLVTKSGRANDDANLNRITEAVRSMYTSWVPTVGGTVNDITVTLDPPITAMSEIVGVPFRIRFAGANTVQNPVIRFNGLGPVALNRAGGDLRVGDLQAGATNLVVYDGGVCRVLSLSNFGVNSNLSTWVRLPDGLIIQRGSGSSSAGGPATITLPIAYSSPSAYRVFVSDESSPVAPSQMSVYGTGAYTTTNFQVCGTRDFANYVADSLNWLTIGY